MKDQSNIETEPYHRPEPQDDQRFQDPLAGAQAPGKSRPGPHDALTYPDKIKPAEIDDILSHAKINTVCLTNKTVSVTVTLANGFEITDTGSCLNPDDFNVEIGKDVAMQRIKDRLWMLEGYHRAAAHRSP